jgi:hypothetical protein
MNELTIGLIVCFGGLFLIGVGIVLRLWLCPQCCPGRDRDGEGIMRMELSVQACDDFMKGCLTTKLYSEIVNLYALKGDLSIYKQTAARLGHKYIIEFLKDPTRHPMVIHKLVGAVAPHGSGVGLDPV